MNKLKDTLNRFLQGRYGMDQLGQALFVVYLAFFVLNLVTRACIFYTLGLNCCDLFPVSLSVQEL